MNRKKPTSGIGVCAIFTLSTFTTAAMYTMDEDNGDLFIDCNIFHKHINANKELLFIERTKQFLTNKSQLKARFFFSSPIVDNFILDCFSN